MTDELDGQIWAYRAVFKQTAAGGGSVVVKIVATERTIILYGVTGPNDYAANRTINCVVNDKDDSSIGRTLFSTAVDNVQLPLITSKTTPAAYDPHQLNERLVLGKGDSMAVTGQSLVQNEELTIAVRALVKSWPPDIDATLSGGTVTTTETYNEMI